MSRGPLCRLAGEVGQMMSEDGKGAEMPLLETFASWAEAALRSALCEFPHGEVLQLNEKDQSLTSFRDRHPSFYGAYDWHSSVEMHWVMVRLLGLGLPERLSGRLMEHLESALTAEKLQVEADRLPSYECPYGCAWLLRLADELEASPLEPARRWSGALGPLAARASRALGQWLGSELPVRSGLHSNSAFAGLLAHGYARARDRELADAISSAARRWYRDDVEYRFSYEPSAHDFLSPGLTEAVLMSEVMAPEEFAAWFEGFAPLREGREALEALSPLLLGDTDDGQAGHLHGLNLSRAYCLSRLAKALPPGERPNRLSALAEDHAAASLGFVAGSSFMLEHWLAAYAVLYST
jgi:hypothetical protein